VMLPICFSACMCSRSTSIKKHIKMDHVRITLNYFMCINE
jgi:hypothetical protein